MAMMCHEGKGKPGMEKFDPSSILRDEIPYLPSEPKNAVLEAQQRTALETERIRREMQEHIEKLEWELEQTRQELADFKAQQKSQHDTDVMQSGLDQKKNRRDMLIGSAFSVGLTLLLEHFPDVVRFFQSIIK